MLLFDATFHTQLLSLNKTQKLRWAKNRARTLASGAEIFGESSWSLIEESRIAVESLRRCRWEGCTFVWMWLIRLAWDIVAWRRKSWDVRWVDIISPFHSTQNHFSNCTDLLSTLAKLRSAEFEDTSPTFLSRHFKHDEKSEFIEYFGTCAWRKATCNLV